MSKACECGVTCLRSSSKYKAKKMAKHGARTVGDIIVLILKILGTICLIGITTSLVFACIFVMYNQDVSVLCSDLDVSLDDLLNLSSVIYYADTDTGQYQELVTLQSLEHRTWVYYEDIPLDMERAAVAIEDKRFYKHNGVDWWRTSGAFVNMFLGCGTLSADRRLRSSSLKTSPVKTR